MVLKLSKDEAKDDRKPIQDDDNTSSMITGKMSLWCDLQST